MHQDSNDCRTTHVRVRAESLQVLRQAVVVAGGKFHGDLCRQASIALEERAAALARRFEKKGSGRDEGVEHCTE
jgi:hypothetical protein